eukprot:IDg19155t1
MYAKLREVFERTSARCVVDSAFLRARHPFLIKSGTAAASEARIVHEIVREREATSAFQSAE